MPLIDLGDVSLNYELSGRLDAPVLLLSNSLGTTLGMWDPQREELEKKYRLLRYDMRGHGASSVPAGPYTVDLLGRDVLALLDALRIDEVYFCGLSVGGVIGQWLGIHAPSRFRKLILCNTAAKIGTAETWNKRIADVQLGGMEAVADAVVQRWFTAEFVASGAPVVTTMRQMLAACNPAGYVAACAAIRDMDLREAVGVIPIPVCLIAGERDAVTTLADAQFLQSHIAGAELVTLPAAHISSAEVPQQFSAAVLKFLAKDVPSE